MTSSRCWADGDAYLTRSRCSTPIGLALLGLGVLKGIYDLVVHPLHIADDTVLIFVSGLIIATLGAARRPDRPLPQHRLSGSATASGRRHHDAVTGMTYGDGVYETAGTDCEITLSEGPAGAAGQDTGDAAALDSVRGLVLFNRAKVACDCVHKGNEPPPLASCVTDSS